MTPLEVEILLHYHYSSGRFPDPYNSPSVASSLSKFEALGVLKKCGVYNDEWCATNPDKLADYVKRVCAVEYEVEKERPWTDEMEAAIRNWQSQPLQFAESPISRKQILLMASAGKYGSVAELLQNADKLERWVRG